MNAAKRYFEKAHIIFELLKNGDEVPVAKVKEALKVSDRVIEATITEFNRFEPTIMFTENDAIKFLGQKKSLTDCLTYKVYTALIEQFLSNPEHYLLGNEIEIAQELGIERSILQKLKTLIKMNSKNFNKN